MMPKGLVVVKFLVWRRHNAVALVTVTLTFLTFIVLFRNDWLHSYNAVSAVFWLPLIWLGGVVSALATVRVHRRDGAERYAVSAATESVNRKRSFSGPYFRCYWARFRERVWGWR